MLVCGIDEAGRGSVLGSLVVAAVVFDEETLVNIPVKDSKKLSAKKRQELFDIIHEHALDIAVVELTADDLNKYHDEKLTINQMEVNAFTQALNDLTVVPNIIYIDAADVIEDRFKNNILAGLKYEKPKAIPLRKQMELKKSSITESLKIPTIICEHKADNNYPVVSAASIVAKVIRDSLMAEIAPVSGYPNKKTIDWIQEYIDENGVYPDNIRLFWKTLDRLKGV